VPHAIVLLAADGSFKLADFGLAKLLDDGQRFANSMVGVSVLTVQCFTCVADA
jgi:hypothetical protein